MNAKVEELKKKIMPNGRAMILAYDQGFEHGTRDFLNNPDSRKLEYILEIAVRGKFTGLVLHAGLAGKFEKEVRASGVPLILKLNGRSELFTGDDPYSPQLYTVDNAIALGATAVGYTVYSGSKYEYKMNKEFAAIAADAHGKGLPVIGWMYPRGSSLFDKASPSGTLKMAFVEQEKSKLSIDETAAIVSYGARIGLELGADIVKVKYTGSKESFKWVVDSAAPTSVVLSGGSPTKTDEEFVNRVKDVLAAGGVGVAVGRNVWQRKDPFSISKKLHDAIFG